MTKEQRLAALERKACAERKPYDLSMLSDDELIFLEALPRLPNGQDIDVARLSDEDCRRVGEIANLMTGKAIRCELHG